MNHRTAYIRRSRKGLRLQKRALAVALLGVTACTGMLLWGGHATLQGGGQDAAPGTTATAAAAVSAPAAVPGGPRRIYPYSIVAGGVSGRAELAHIIQTDKVVAAHYASFEVARAHPVTVAKPRAVHVSYRKGDQVYWTAKKVMLAEGETLLSDGKNEIRGRCGNRISEVAMLPVEAAAPGEEELDAAVDDAGDGGALQVAAPFGSDGAGRYAHQLLTYPNGAGLLAVTGGEGWRAPGSPFGSGVAGPAYPGFSYGTPVALTGGSSAQVGTGATTPAAGTTPVAGTTPTDTPIGTASGGGSTSETPHGSTPGSTPTETASTGGSTSETPRGGGLADTTPVPAPADGGTGGSGAIPSGDGTPPAPVGLPGGLADTVQPEPEPDIKAPALPETVLSPVELPAVPVKTVETTAEAPEPATLWLSGAGMAAMLLLRRRRHRRA